jgi:hypothetical protein
MTNVKRYIIDYVKFVTERLPDPEIRREEVVAYAMALVSPVITLYNQLLAFRSLLLYKLTITPQVCYLEKMLNDQYDTDLRRIYISDSNQYEGLFIYTEGEDQPLFLFTEAEVAKPKTFVYTEGEGSIDGSNDFVIFYPVGLEFEMNEMISLINTFKLASKLFSIQPF